LTTDAHDARDERLEQGPVDLRVAGLFEEGPHDLGAFEHGASTARLEQGHDVAEVVTALEVQFRVSLGEPSPWTLALARVSHVEPFVAHLSKRSFFSVMAPSTGGPDAPRGPSTVPRFGTFSHAGHDARATHMTTHIAET
jgi:hypothetical protein